MAKNKKGKTAKEIKPLEIISGSIVDGKCNYSYKINQGVGIGNKHNVTGTGIVDDSMYKAFKRFNAHIACYDDVFKHSKIDVESIDLMHNNELTALYSVHGFKIKGNDPNQKIIIIGDKYVDSGGRISISTPEIPVDKLSSYLWFEELKAEMESAREEVESYHNGNCTFEEKSTGAVQLNITDQADSDKEFEASKL